MAYAVLNETTYTSKSDLFIAFRDFLSSTGTHNGTGIGWTVHDSSYAVDSANPQLNDWVVFQTNGENGDAPFYFRFEWTSGNFRLSCGTFWNSTTNSFGSIVMSNLFPFTSADALTEFVMEIGGDLDQAIVWYRDSVATSNRFGFTFGRYTAMQGWSTGVVSTTSTVSSGTDIAITFDQALPSDWAVGIDITLWSGDGNVAQWAEIKTINSGTNTITADITNTMTGTPIRASRHLGFGCSSSRNPISLNLMFGLTGVINNSLSARSFYNAFSGSGINPNPLDGSFALFPFILGGTGGWVLLKHVLGGPNLGTSVIANGDVLNDGTDTWKRYSSLFYWRQ